MRVFKTGASRDENQDKINYEGCYDPLIIQAFGEYMHKHAKLPDGTYRKEGNWKNLFGENHLDVCMESLWRHFIDLDLFHNGYKGRDTIDDAICGIIFNIQAYYYKLLKEKYDPNRIKKTRMRGVE